MGKKKQQQQPVGTSPARTRVPFADRSNTTSPLSARWARKDSDDSNPSQHSSIYDAECIADAHMASIRKTSPRPVTILSRPQPGQIKAEDLRSESPLSRLETTPFLYGHGTELRPIAEQRSIATLRTTSFSTSDLSSMLHDAPGLLSQAGSGRSIPPRLRRRQSFSLDDLDHIQHYNNIHSKEYRLEPILSSPSSASENDVHLQDDNTHKYPHSPPYSPPMRNRTPKDLFKLIETRDHLTGRNYAANTWVRLVQRSPSIRGQRTSSQHPQILNGRPLPDRRTSYTPPIHATETSVDLRRSSISNHGMNIHVLCAHCKRPVEESWSL